MSVPGLRMLRARSNKMRRMIFGQIPALRILRLLIRKRCIRSRKPPLRPTKVPRPKVIQPRLRIPFLARKTSSAAPAIRFQSLFVHEGEIWIQTNSDMTVAKP